MEVIMFFIQISLELVPLGLIDSKLTLDQVMTLHLTGNKPLPEPIFTLIYDAMGHIV